MTNTPTPTLEELEIRLASNIYYLEELMKLVGNVEIESKESNGTMVIDLAEIIEDLQSIGSELDKEINPEEDN